MNKIMDINKLNVSKETFIATHLISKDKYERISNEYKNLEKCYNKYKERARRFMRQQ